MANLTGLVNLVVNSLELIDENTGQQSEVRDLIANNVVVGPNAGARECGRSRPTGPKPRSPTSVRSYTSHPTLPTRYARDTLAKSPPNLLEGEPGCHALETLRGRIGLLFLSR